MRDNGILCDFTNGITTVHGSILQIGLPIYTATKRDYFVRTIKAVVIPTDVKLRKNLRTRLVFCNQRVPANLNSIRVAHSIHRIHAATILYVVY